MRRLLALGLGTLLAGSACSEPEKPPRLVDANFGTGGGTLGGSTGHGDAGSDGSVQDGGTGRCTAQELVFTDSPSAQGLGFSVAARAADFVVAWASRDTSLVPASNVYARSVDTAGNLGTTNGYLVADTPVVDPIALPRTSGVLLAYGQLFSEVGGVQTDIATQHLDVNLAADANAQRATTTTGDEIGLGGVSTSEYGATLAMLTVAVDPATSQTTTALAFGDLDVDGLFSYGPVEIPGTSNIAGPPAVASIDGVPHAAFRRTTGSIDLVSLTHPGLLVPTSVASAIGGDALDLDGNLSGGALVFDSTSGGRGVVRLVALDSSGGSPSPAVDVTSAPIAARDGAVAMLGTNRLVVYRGTADGSTYVLRAAYVDALGRVVSDQPIAGSIASQGTVELASSGSDRALAVFAQPSLTGTTSSPGYRLRGVLLACP